MPRGHHARYLSSLCAMFQVLILLVQPDLPHRARGRSWNITLTFVVVTQVHRAVAAFRLRVNLRTTAKVSAPITDARPSVTAEKAMINACLDSTAASVGIEAHVTAQTDVEQTTVLVPRRISAVETGRKAWAKRLQNNEHGVSKKERRPRLKAKYRTYSGGRVVSLFPHTRLGLGLASRSQSLRPLTDRSLWRTQREGRWRECAPFLLG